MAAWGIPTPPVTDVKLIFLERRVQALEFECAALRARTFWQWLRYWWRLSGKP